MSDEHLLPSIREKQIFSKARALPVAARAAYLDRVCGADHKLRASVEALLLCDGKEDLLAEASPIFQPSSTAGAAIGSSIGRYKLLEIIGEGGGGVVYRAVQDCPVHRQVALKLIKPGIHTKQQLLRFEAEWQALAKMNSSNFAKVLDAGSADDGRPYFVMEQVEGKAITAYADDKEFTLLQRLDLFVKVCKAVHDAHLKGSIHRDIKPSNILIATESGEPVPKVIDFGIAKPTVGEPARTELLSTTTGQFIGTPTYMSPEQAGADIVESDRRTDIYSLGVLLHEVVVGCVPFTLDGLNPYELRTIREKKPERPSTKFKSLPEKEMLRIAHTRKTEPSRLVDALRGGLDRIVMRCLEKRREDRYDTADSLAMAIQGWSMNQTRADEVTSSLGLKVTRKTTRAHLRDKLTRKQRQKKPNPGTSGRSACKTGEVASISPPASALQPLAAPPREIPPHCNQSLADRFSGMPMEQVRTFIVAAMSSSGAKEFLKELLHPDTTIAIAHKLATCDGHEHAEFYCSGHVPKKLKTAISDVIYEMPDLLGQVRSNLEQSGDYLYYLSAWFALEAQYFPDHVAGEFVEKFVENHRKPWVLQSAMNSSLLTTLILIENCDDLNSKCAITILVELCFKNKFSMLRKALAREDRRDLVFALWEKAPKWMTSEQVKKLERFLIENRVIRSPDAKYNIHFSPQDIPGKFELLTLGQTKRILKQLS